MHVLLLDLIALSNESKLEIGSPGLASSSRKTIHSQRPHRFDRYQSFRHRKL